MKNHIKFILRFFAFVGTVLLIVVIMWNIVTITRAKLCSRPDKKTLVFGNSRIQYGFDDTSIPSVWNVGLNADNYNLIYWKLQLLHKYNEQIQSIILEVDQTFLFNYVVGVEYKLHPYYWDIMDFTDWMRLWINDKTVLMYPFDWIKILMPVKSLFSTVSFQELGIGGYSRLNRDKLNEALIEEGRNDIEFSNIRKNVDELQLEYLNKIIKYCQQHNIRIIFVSMPSYPTKKIEVGHRLANQYIKMHFPDIKYHDYELVEFADSCYGDIIHLNYKGANALAGKLKVDLDL